MDCVLPSVRDLAIALVRASSFWPKTCLVIVSCAGLLPFEYGWMLAGVFVFALAFDTVLNRRSRMVLRSWRAARRRRSALNSAIGRNARQATLIFDLTTMVHDARRSWDVYMADAIAGRTQAVIYDRPPPDVTALERLHRATQRAGELGVGLEDDGLTISGADAVLPVPPRAGFAADVLSPTMMNLNAASLAHAKVEGVARADRRHQRALVHAAAFAPMMAFAEAAIEALALASLPPALP